MKKVLVLSALTLTLAGCATTPSDDALDAATRSCHEGLLEAASAHSEADDFELMVEDACARDRDADPQAFVERWGR